MSKKSTTMTVKLICVVLFNIIYSQANPIVQINVGRDENLLIYSDGLLPVDNVDHSDDYQVKTETDLNSMNIPSLVMNKLADSIDEDETSKMLICVELPSLTLLYENDFSIVDDYEFELAKQITARLCGSKE